MTILTLVLLAIVTFLNAKMWHHQRMINQHTESALTILGRVTGLVDDDREESSDTIN